jgi:probable rRNA maturation factor
MINLEVYDSAQVDSPDKLIRAAAAVLAMEGKSEDTELTIAVQMDRDLRQLNRDFLGIDAPTDVLSFPAYEFDPDNQSQYIGDVIISYERAEEQAKKADHPIINEIQLLVVHGVLHLFGYDHVDEMQKQKMWQIQADILKQIGCVINKLPE